MNKFVIKNCPLYIQDVKECAEYFDFKMCKDITDCLLKRIVELCKSESEPQYLYERVRTGKVVAILGVKYNRGVDFAQKILKLLEIEECENE